MHIGAVFPHEVELDRPSDLDDLLIGIEDLGFDYISLFDHVGGAPAAQLSDLAVVPYTNDSPFFEALVTLAYAAAVTSTLELATGVLVLPQRQVVLVAKQLATIDYLSGGRLRVGLGVGWNPAEYEALGADFRRRGDLLDEQVGLLQQLWTEPVVSASGPLHKWQGIGLSPRPHTPPPIWFGGVSPRALRRAARVGQGWIPPMIDTDSGLPPDLNDAFDRLDAELAAAGRDRDRFGIEGRARWSADSDPRAIASAHESWRRRGASHFGVSVQLEHRRDVGSYLKAFAQAIGPTT